LENQKKQIKMIEMTMIPMLEHDVSSAEGWIDQLTEEIGTNLTSTFGKVNLQMVFHVAVHFV
jgi:hypothetical protein